MRVREATEHDAASCAAIYAPYVTGSVISFELEPPSEAEMAARIAAAHDWLVLEDDAGHVAGYAYAGPMARRAAYRWATEVSVYLDRAFRRRGGGRMLYEALLPRLAARGFRMAIAGMTLPNDASVGLHRALGFQPVGTYRRIGYKHGAWHDVVWTQRALIDGDGHEPPAEPR